MPQISSFDIFDTVLTRLVIDPTDIFKICGDRAINFGWLEISAESFRQLRINAEQRSRLFYEGGEVNLDEIYRELANSLEIPIEIIDKLKELELTVESEYLVPVPQADDLITEARRSHSQILFLSDMYLPPEFLESQLKKHGFWQEGDRLFVSGQWRKSKGNGDLFLQVISELSLKPSDLVHIGNNRHADVAKPRKLGINTVYVDDANPNRYETIFAKYAQNTNGITSLWAGISRYTRLTESAKTPKESILRDIAVSVAAPILTAYVIWILRQAQVRQLARIYFLARDGEVLLKIAQELAPQIYPEVELRYLYVSRQALRMPGLTKINKAFWEWMFDDTDIFTIESLLARMCLDQASAQPIFEQVGYPCDRWTENLSAKERLALRSKLETNQEIHSLVLAVAIQKREVLRAYLQQEKMLDGKAFGLVDVGWRGSLQVSLENAFELFGTRYPVGFYFALDQPTGGQKFKGEAIAYFFNLNNSTGFRNEIDYRYVSAMEVFCAGCEGTTLDYALQTDNSVVPVLKHSQNRPALDWGLKSFQQNVIAFVQNLVERSPNDLAFTLSLNSPKLLRKAIDDLFLAFNKYPTKPEAEAFRDCPFFDDPNEFYHFYWAMPFRLTDVLKYAIAKRNGFNVHRNAWSEASLQVSSPLVKMLVPVAIAQRKILKRCKKLVNSIRKTSFKD
jgi:predicted HAD superfamily hydrolase